MTHVVSLGRRSAMLGAGLAVVLVPASFAGWHSNAQALPSQALDSAVIGAISGAVRDASSGLPIADASVTLRVQSGVPVTLPTERTDDNGRFVFLDVPVNADLEVLASKPGYLAGAHGQHTPEEPVTLLRLVAKEWRRDVTLLLWGAGAIEGSVFDPRGQPASGIVLRALQLSSVGGRSAWSAATKTETDDRGQYRLGGLTPGQYVVGTVSEQVSVPTEAMSQVFNTREQGKTIEQGKLAPSVPVDAATRLLLTPGPPPRRSASGHLLIYPALFYPGARLPQAAAAIEVSAATTHGGIDLQLVQETAVMVRGTVLGASNQTNRLAVRLVPVGMEELGVGTESALARVDPDGQFTLVATPGDYVLNASGTISEFERVAPMSATAMAPYMFPGIGGAWGLPVTVLSHDLRVTTVRIGAASLYGSEPITVGPSDVSGVVLRMQATARVQGTVEPPTAPSDVAGDRIGLNIFAEPADGTLSGGVSMVRYNLPGNGDEFTVEGLTPGRYFVRVKCDTPSCRGWLTKSIEHDGSEYVNRPIDVASGDSVQVRIVLANDPAALEGQVHLAPGTTSKTTVTAYAVVAFPSRADRWAEIGLDPPDFEVSVVGDTGRYAFPRLPAGDYDVALIPRSSAYSWLTPTELARLAASAKQVTLEWGATKSLDLLLANGSEE